jgi:hypothetical protein
MTLLLGGPQHGVRRGERHAQRGRGVIENKHSADVDSPPPPPRICMSIQAFTLKISRAPMSVDCLFSMTLLPPECWHVISLWGVDVVLELIDPACSQRPSCEVPISGSPFTLDLTSNLVGRCRLTVSKIVLKAHTVSALEATIRRNAFKLCVRYQLVPLQPGVARAVHGRVLFQTKSTSQMWNRLERTTVIHAHLYEVLHAP